MMKKLYALCLCALLVFTFAPRAWAATPPSSDVLYEGVDVSRWQGEIDFAKVKQAGVQVVMIRSSVGGGGVDPYFERNYAGAKAQGLQVGVYHFLTARTVAEAQEQARFFVDTLAGKQLDLRLVMDFGRAEGLSRSQINLIGQAFLSAVEALSGKGAAVYSDASSARTVWDATTAAAYPLWVAQYGVSQPEDTNWDSWAGFQYTDKGRVPGIQGYVDRDRFTKEMFLDDPAPLPGPTPDPPDTPERKICVTVQRGDTLTRLAARFDTTVSAIVKTNDIRDPDLIYVGQKLCIFTHAHSKEDQTCDRYTVQRGDTLTRIAARFRTTAAELARINDIQNPDLIYVGQVLKV